MRYAVLDGDTVVNIAVAEPDVAADRGWVEAPAEVSAGWTYTDGVFAPPAPEPEPVPEAITNRQARLALLSAGLLTAAENALDGLPSPDKEAAIVEWEYATEVRRGHPLIESIAIALGLTEQEVDDLFRAGAAL